MKFILTLVALSFLFLINTNQAWAADPWLLDGYDYGGPGLSYSSAERLSNGTKIKIRVSNFSADTPMMQLWEKVEGRNLGKKLAEFKVSQNIILEYELIEPAKILIVCGGRDVPPGGWGPYVSSSADSIEFDNDVTHMKFKNSTKYDVKILSSF